MFQIIELYVNDDYKQHTFIYFDNIFQTNFQTPRILCGYTEL